MRVLQLVAAKLANSRDRWFTDNQNVPRIMQVGSSQPILHSIALQIFGLSIQHNIRVEPEWIPRELNERADYLSRIIDCDDWYINPEVFFEVNQVWGPHSIDRFANFHNAQLKRFNSRWWNPGSEAVDAFSGLVKRKQLVVSPDWVDPLCDQACPSLQSTRYFDLA